MGYRAVLKIIIKTTIEITSHLPQATAHTDIKSLGTPVQSLLSPARRRGDGCIGVALDVRPSYFTNSWDEFGNYFRNMRNIWENRTR